MFEVMIPFLATLNNKLEYLMMSNFLIQSYYVVIKINIFIGYRDLIINLNGYGKYKILYRGLTRPIRRICHEKHMQNKGGRCELTLRVLDLFIL